MNPHVFRAARQRANLGRDELAARAAAIGHRWHTTHAPDAERGPLREDLREYIVLIEEEEPVELPANHPYLRWYGEALNTPVIQLIDGPA